MTRVCCFSSKSAFEPGQVGVVRPPQVVVLVSRKSVGAKLYDQSLTAHGILQIVMPIGGLTVLRLLSASQMRLVRPKRDGSRPAPSAPKVPSVPVPSRQRVVT